MSYIPEDRCGTDVQFNLNATHYDFIGSYDYTMYNDLGVDLVQQPNPNTINIVNYNFDLPGIYALEIILNNNKKVYRVRIRLKGYSTETATFDRLTDARKWAASIESSIREGRHFKSAEAKKHTLGEMVDRYKRDVLPTKSNSMQQNQWTHLNWWKDTLQNSSKLHASN